jgi:putative RNA 2'-phosphotransferase
VEHAERTRVSKRLSYVLRHDPGSIGIKLDDAGWVDIDELLGALRSHGLRLRRDQLDEVVETNEKQRYTIEGNRIRANQGHSVGVQLDLPPASPPDVLFHGTPERNVVAILSRGLNRGTRHHVHLSPDVATAQKVGQRRGRAVVLRIDAAGMAGDGYTFYVSDNGVWLTDQVPAAYIRAE